MSGSGNVTLVVNPAARRGAALRQVLPGLRGELLERGFDVHILSTKAEWPTFGEEDLRLLKSSGLVLVCGGDGTVHSVVQHLAGTPVPLGVVPLGTANALARNLRIPLEPLAAVRALLHFEPRRIPLGQISTARSNRYFIVMAGCGPDGALAALIPGALKARLGRAAYYAYAAHLFATRSWPRFWVRYRRTGEAVWHDTEAVSLMASRVANLGGLFRGLTASSHLLQPTLQLRILRAPARISMPAWLTLSRLGIRHGLLETIDAEEASCEPIHSTMANSVHAQADAEPLGPLPMTLRLIRDSLTLLMPRPSTRKLGIPL